MSKQKWEKLQPTFSLEDERLNALKSIVPEAFADGKIDFDALRELLGETVEESDEHFGLNWTGKSEARRLAGMPSKGTLVPVPGKGLQEETTQNIFIEGDNLEVLKLLHKAYRGRIKMIYIDPPYNTGKDFIYKDDYRAPLESYLERSGQKSEAGELLTSNPKGSGRFHSDWLNMMYPRLRIAKDMLRSDGVIFISIDDNEIHNLKHLLNEIFGEENFEGHIHWRRRSNQPNDKTKMIGLVAEHLIAYSKDKEFFKKAGVGKVDLTGTFSNPDNDPRGDWASKPWKVGSDQSGSRYKVTNPNTGEIYDEDWMGDEDNYLAQLADKRIYFPRDGAGLPRKKYFRSEREEEGQCATNWWSHTEFGNNQGANDQMTAIFGKKNVFSNPKPLELLRGLLQISNAKKDDIVMDFFAGSGTTPHAVFEMNAADKSDLHFVCVQLDEKISEGEVAFELGFRTISEITAERIRKVSANLKNASPGDSRDLGFKFFRLNQSNFRAWSDFVGNDLDQLRGLLQSQIDSTFTPDAEDEAIFTEALLLEGFPLTSQVEEDDRFEKNSVRSVQSPFSEHRLFITLDKEVQEETIRQAEELEKIDIFICLDSALTDRDKVRLADVCRLKTI